MNKRLTKSEKATAKQQAREQLTKMIRDGDTVYTVLNHVSSSGMSRRISCFIAVPDTNNCNNGRPYIQNISYYVARALDYRRNEHDGGIVIGGCGMDMGYHIVNSLEYALFGINPLSDATKPHLRHQWL